MRSIIETTILYNFDELSSESKEKAKQNITEVYRDGNGYMEIVNEEINRLFPNSALKVQYSLNSCQGDGVNIYGRLNVYDMLNYLKENTYVNENEQRLMDQMKGSAEYIGLPYNSRYSYCVVSQAAIADDLEFYLQESENILMTEQRLRNMEERIVYLLESLCGYFERIGYNWFCELDDDELKEIIETNEIEFFQDGRLYL